MSDQVYVLGAGFSKAIDHHMPTTLELGETITESLRQTQHLQQDFSLERYDKDFELWLSYLANDQPWLTTEEQLKNKILLGKATTAVGDEVRQRELNATYWAEDEAFVHGGLSPNADTRGEFTRLGAHWAGRPGALTACTVITFNYDTFAERLIMMGGYDKDWHHLYVPPLVLPGGAFWPGRSFRQDDSFDSLHAAVLKLHGSLNWKSAGPDRPDQNIHLTGSAAPDWRSSEGYRDGLEFAWSYLQTLIVPPTAMKSAYYAIPALAHQWTAAREAIRTATKVIMLGYSLPPTDQAVHAFFAETLPGREVVFVNRRKDDGLRLVDIVGAKNVNFKYTGTPNPIPDYIRAEVP
ncbi:hypothetical protein [Angustibacter luteus]|uniref:SIR2-like domain-containing protein n=1 Tax=Angustibacter luteus TaxID=658456 RepID=A0ABW1JKE6_9ACTN